MHEYSLTIEIINTAEKYAVKNNGKSVKEINLVIGEYAGCVPESIEMYFDIIAEGTKCEDAKLNIEKIKPMLRCKSCNRLFLREPFSFSCTHDGCNGEGEPTEIGREFYIKSIVIENNS